MVSSASYSPFWDKFFFKKLGLDGFLRRMEDGVKSSVYVVYMLEAALWAFLTTDTFKGGALRVVNLGNDADMVGAVYGGLVGVWGGVENCS